MAEKLRIVLIRSGINRTEHQKGILKALGLRKLHGDSVVKDGAAVRGMIRKVAHLVRIEAAE